MEPSSAGGDGQVPVTVQPNDAMTQGVVVTQTPGGAVYASNAQAVAQLPLQAPSTALMFETPERTGGQTFALQRAAFAASASVELEKKTIESGKKHGRKGQDREGSTGRKRAKKPPDAPRRPKSPYMFFLAEFREQYKKDNPESKKVAEVAKAAGGVWRGMTDKEKAQYEEKSTNAKAQYAKEMEEYTKEHPKPQRRNKRDRDPSELKRPQGAYFFFLKDFREAYKKEHPGDQPQAKLMGKLAGEKWKSMTPEERAPYEQMSEGSKAEYKRVKEMSFNERLVRAAAVAVEFNPPAGPATGQPALQISEPPDAAEQQMHVSEDEPPTLQTGTEEQKAPDESVMQTEEVAQEEQTEDAGQQRVAKDDGGDHTGQANTDPPSDLAEKELELKEEGGDDYEGL